MERKHLLVLAVVGMGLLAGCMDMTITTEVNAEGDIDQMDVEMELDQFMFGFLEESAEEEGYDSVEEMLADDFSEDLDEDEVGDVSVSVTPPDDRDGSDYLVTMSVSDIPAEEMDEVETEVGEDSVRFVDTSIGGADETPDDPGDMDDFGDFGEALDEGAQIEYVVVMPGEIQDHNADEISDDGTTATWNLAGEEPDEQLFAESTIEDDSDSIPGFGVTAAVAALLATVGLLARRNLYNQ